MFKRCFHSSATAFARKAGATAFVAGPRNLSKKQKKRKSTRLKAREAIVDQKKLKTKEKLMGAQIDTDEMRVMITDMNARLEGAFQDLLLPDGLARLDIGEEQPKKEIPRRDPMLSLYALRNKKQRQDLLLSGEYRDAAVSQEEAVYLTAQNAQNKERKDSTLSVILDRDIREAEIPDDHQMNISLISLVKKEKFKELSEVNFLYFVGFLRLIVNNIYLRSYRYEAAYQYFVSHIAEHKIVLPLRCLLLYHYIFVCCVNLTFNNTVNTNTIDNKMIINRLNHFLCTIYFVLLWCKV